MFYIHTLRFKVPETPETSEAARWSEAASTEVGLMFVKG